MFFCAVLVLTAELTPPLAVLMLNADCPPSLTVPASDGSWQVSADAATATESSFAVTSGVFLPTAIKLNLIRTSLLHDEPAQL
jgi:hypothetical protein